MLGFCVTLTAKVIRRRDLGLKSHPKDWRSPGSISGPLVYKAGSLTARPRRLHSRSWYRYMDSIFQRINGGVTAQRRFRFPDRSDLFVNPYMTNGLSHPYQLDESIFNFRGIRSIFSFSISFFDETNLSKQNSPRWDAILFVYVP